MSDKMKMEQYRDIFISESEEHLQALNKSILALERKPQDLGLLNEIFRSAHTIKGMSATMGFEELATLSHHMEDVLDAARSRKMKITPEIIDILFKCLDNLEVLLKGVREGKEAQTDISPLLDGLKDLVPAALEEGRQLKEPAAVEVKAEEGKLWLNPFEREVAVKAIREGYHVFHILITLVKDCSSKAIRAFMVMKNLDEFGEVIKTVPPPKELEEERFDLSFSAVLITKENQRKIQKSIRSIAEIEKVKIMPLKIEEIERQKPEEREVPREDLTLRKIASIRVSTERLDKLMNLVGELVISKIRLIQTGQTYKLRELNEILSVVDGLVSELQNEVIQARLVPLDYIFNRFPRMVRDLAKEDGKQVDLKIIGGEIELDRTVMDEIGEPLVHLLRNGVDHGIEMPSERRRLGKPPVGTVELKAVRERTYVSIEVSDDGRGIDPERIRELAVNRGLFTEEELSGLTDKEVLMLLAHPGFTISERVTEISGRGVGLDIVKTKIESLGGKVDFESKLGEGSRFTLEVPLTVAVIQALLVNVAGETYAIPIDNIRETIKVERSRIRWVEKHEVIRLRDEVIPLVRLHKVLGIKEGAAHRGDKDQKTIAEAKERGPDANEQFLAVVIEVGPKKAGLIVDALIGQQDVVIKSFGTLLKGIKGFAGATILGDGRVALILDVATLV